MERMVIGCPKTGFFLFGTAGIFIDMMQANAEHPRLREVDIAKGMACLLMIVAHEAAGSILQNGTFSAPLFFAFSGMNTVLLAEKTRTSRAYDVFHVLFPVILFLGGTIQVAVAHNGHWLIFP